LKMAPIIVLDTFLLVYLTVAGDSYYEYFRKTKVSKFTTW
jgi:hypothetical protein